MVKQKTFPQESSEGQSSLYAESSRLKVQHFQPRLRPVSTVRSVVRTQRAIAERVPHKVEFQQVR